MPQKTGVNNPKVILITGCSSGFGLLTAARLSTQNKVIATMRNLNKKQPLLDEVKKRGGEVDIKFLDVTDTNSIRQCVNEIIARYNRIDVLINNAGYGIGGFFEDLTESEIRAQMETNFFGVQNVAREVIPFMRRQNSGKIINISSVSGFSASPCFGAYCASKWALEAFSESLRYELAQFGIQVLLIEPGTYNTPIFHENARAAKNFSNPNSPYYKTSQRLKETVDDYVKRCKKNPEDIAALAEKLINRNNPPFRNIPDAESRFMFILRKILPFGIYSWIISKVISASAKETNRK